MRCTGPYTRVLFDRSDAKTARALIEVLDALGHTLEVRHLPQGTSGLDDFALDVDLRVQGDEGMVSEPRAAK